MAEPKSIAQALDALNERFVYADSLARTFTNVFHTVPQEVSDDWQWCFLFRETIEQLKAAAEDVEIRVRLSLLDGDQIREEQPPKPLLSFPSADNPRPRSGAGAKPQ